MIRRRVICRPRTARLAVANFHARRVGSCPQFLWKTLWTNCRAVAFALVYKAIQTDWPKYRRNMNFMKYNALHENHRTKRTLRAGTRSVMNRSPGMCKVESRSTSDQMLSLSFSPLSETESRVVRPGVDGRKDTEPTTSDSAGARMHGQLARCVRSASITGPVRGSLLRQMRNASAACSTSIPRPSVATAAPSSTPQRTNGVGCAA